MARITTFDEAMAVIWDRSGYDRGFISNPFAGDDAARLGLVRTARTLERLGHPDRDYPIVHVAGSKGKGSTCAFIDHMLRASGVATGRFLSPHLHSYLERFVVDGQEIGESDFTTLVNDASAAALEVEADDPDVGQLTAWELSTAMALLWFSRSRCGAAVVEVGLGGTLDATNVVEPAISVITRLDYEHTAILGSTMAAIASNKAGIINRDRPVVCASQPVEALRVIESRAAELGAPLLLAGRDWTASGTSDSFSVESPGWSHANLRSSLFGQHQVENAGLAIAAVHALSETSGLAIDLPDGAVRHGIATAVLAGRFEVVSHESGVVYVIDGAHTPHSMRSLADAVRARFPSAHVTVVAGMLGDKDPGSVLAPLVAVADRWIVTPLRSPRALGVEQIMAPLIAQGEPVESSTDVEDAIARATDTGQGPDRQRVVVVTGSFSTVADARTALDLA